MLKKLLLTSLMCLPIMANAEDEPLPPPEPIMIRPFTPLPFNKAPVGSLYLTEQEKNALQNNLYYLNNNISKLNYSLDLGYNKKHKLIQAIFDSIDRNETIYDALHIKYHIKYNRQCPIDFVNTQFLAVDRNICHETFNEYLKQNQLYQSYRDKQKYTEPPILPTFWHDTPYYVPDESYLTYKQNDIFVDNYDKRYNRDGILYKIKIKNLIHFSQKDIVYYAIKNHKAIKIIYNKVIRLDDKNNTSLLDIKDDNKNYIIKYKNKYIILNTIDKYSDTVIVWGSK